MSFRFRCRTCGEDHVGMPALTAHAPLYYYSVPEGERAERCELTNDICVVDREFFFVRGNIEIPVHGLDERFAWGVWVSLSQANFDEYTAHYERADRDNLGPYFGWLSAALRGYPDTENLKINAVIQPPPIRPLIELEPTGHPLAVEQREGISQERLAEIYALHVHG
jgi:hypothetical protein